MKKHFDKNTQTIIMAHSGPNNSGTINVMHPDKCDRPRLSGSDYLSEVVVRKEM